MTQVDENVWTVWDDYPNPRSMDRDDLSEALDHLDPVSYNEDEREIFSDWYRMVAEDVRDEVALYMPHKVMAAEVVVFKDLKGVYRRVIQRNSEVRHLHREIAALQKTIEHQRSTINLMALRIKELKGAVEDAHGSD